MVGVWPGVFPESSSLSFSYPHPLMKSYLTILLLGLPLLAAAQTDPGRHATVLDLTGAVGPTVDSPCK